MKLTWRYFSLLFSFGLVLSSSSSSQLDSSLTRRQQVQGSVVTNIDSSTNNTTLTRAPVRLCVKEDPSVCFQLQDLGAKVSFTFEFPKTYGWISLGLGLWMANSDQFVLWYSSSTKEYILSDRKGLGNLDSQYDLSQDLSLDPTKSKLIGDRHSVTFTRAKDTKDVKGDSLINEESEDFIWAYSKVAMDSIDPKAKLELHDLFGRFRLNMFQDGLATDLGDSLEGMPTAVQTWFNLIHGIFLFLGWNVYPFLGILVAGPLRLRLGRWWFKLHLMFLALLAPLFVLVGIVLAMVWKQSTHFSSTHEVLGLIVIIFTFLQIGLGIFIDKKYNPNRVQIPWYDQLHHHFGRLLFLLAQVAIILGILRYQPIPSKSLNVFIGYGILLFLQLGLYIFLKYPTKRIHRWLHLDLDNNKINKNEESNSSLALKEFEKDSING